MNVNPQHAWTHVLQTLLLFPSLIAQLTSQSQTLERLQIIPTQFPYRRQEVAREP